MMVRHAKQRRFVFTFHGQPGRTPGTVCLGAQRTPGAAWERQPTDPRLLAEGAPDDAVLRRFLEAMHRWRLEDSNEPVPVPPDTVRRTAELVLSRHFDPVADGNAEHTISTLRGFLLALADAAESDLDTGRIVVREAVKRARAMADAPLGTSRADARNAAKALRDVLTLLEREGWSQPSGVETEAADV
jgi:hypothetical protein